MSHVNEIPFRDLLCRRVRGRLDAYLDGELLTETSLELLRHLSGCEECGQELDGRARVRNRLKAAVRQTEAPVELASRVRGRLRDPRRSNFMDWGLFVAQIAVAIVSLQTPAFGGNHIACPASFTSTRSI